MTDREKYVANPALLIKDLDNYKEENKILKVQNEYYRDLLSDILELIGISGGCSYWDMDTFITNKEKQENIIKEISDSIGGGKGESKT